MNQLQAEALREWDAVDYQEVEEVEASERYEITDLGGADWAFEKLAAINSRIKEKQTLAEEKRFKIDSWLESETKQDKESIAFFENLLINYFVRLRQNDPKAKLSTPSGKVTSRKQQPAWTFEETAAIEYFKTNHPEMIAVKESFNKTEAKKLLQPLGDGQVVDENGEVLEFVKAMPQGESYTVKVD